MEEKTNQNVADRFTRVFISAIFMLSASYLRMSTFLSWALATVGLYLMLTGLSGFCPVYHIFKINTKSKFKEGL